MSDGMRRILNIIIAILVSIVGWTFVIYNNDPMTEVKYKDVPIIFTGEDTLANEGLGVSDVSDETIDVTLRQQRVDTANISIEDIDVIADVSNAAEGQNGISLQITGPDGTQVSEAEKRSISIEVETSDTVEKKIYVQYDGSTAGYEPVTTRNTSSFATVIGAESEVARVDRVAAVLTLDQTSDQLKNFTSLLTAFDSDGEEIDHVVIYPGEINFNAYTGTLKEVALNVVTEDRNAEADEASDDEENTGDGYTRKVSAPDNIVIKGSAEAVANVNEISTEPIVLSDMYEDQEVELQLILPDGVYPASDYEELTVKVRVTRDTSADKSKGE